MGLAEILQLSTAFQFCQMESAVLCEGGGMKRMQLLRAVIRFSYQTKAW